MRIFYVHPRLTGSVQDWSGLNDPAGRSWLIDHTKELNFNAIWFSPFFATSDLHVERHGKQVSGSLYAIKDHTHLDQEFSALPDEPDAAVRGPVDDKHVRHFTKQAKDAGITVMGDLVFNHVARDHALVLQENAQVAHIIRTAQNIRPIIQPNSHGHWVLVGMEYDVPGGAANKKFNFKFNRDQDYTLTMPGVWVNGPNGSFFEKWDDVAQINYASPEANEFFVTGKPGQKAFWKQVVDWHIDRGFTGFRCDAAYLMPAYVWSEIAQYAHNRLPGVKFMGETLGDNGMADALKEAKIKVNGKEQLAFDLAMLPTYWWNFKDASMIDETNRLLRISRFGGAGFPDNHDTDNTKAGHAQLKFAFRPEAERNRVVSDICVRDYAVATLISSSVYMQMGYEYCRKQISVFRDPDSSPYWKQLRAERSDPAHPLNIGDRIKAINDFKEKLHDANVIVRLDKVSYAGHDQRLLKLECRLIDAETQAEKGRMLLFVNERPEDGAIKIKQKDLKGDKAGVVLDRLVLGSEDTEPEHIAEIKDVAAFYTPLPNQPSVNPVPVLPPHQQQQRPPQAPGLAA